MTWTIAHWMLIAGGPLLGITAIVALALFHEHGHRREARHRPSVARRAASALLDDYLADDRGASLAAWRAQRSALLVQTARASTTVLDEYLEDRARGFVAPVPRRQQPDRPATPVLPAARPRPVISPARQPRPRPVAAPAFAFHRPARSTRLMPLA